MVFETLKVSKEGAAVFVEIVRPAHESSGARAGPRFGLSHSANLGGRGRQGAHVRERRRHRESCALWRVALP